MHRLTLSAALCTLLLGSGVSAPASAADAQFTDNTCPQANDSGRKLNALNAAGNVNGDDLIAASQGLVDAYRDCVRASDRDQYTKNADHQSDYVMVARVYSRLQLARSLQRIGSFDEQLHQPDKAREVYASALTPLDEIGQIASQADIAIADRASGQTKMLAQSKSLHDEIAASIAQLPAPAASATPIAK